MINFIAIGRGEIQLYCDDDFIAASNQVNVIVKHIQANGGPANEIYATSSCFEAEDHGFNSQKEFDDLWDEVCDQL